MGWGEFNKKKKGLYRTCEIKWKPITYEDWVRHQKKMKAEKINYCVEDPRYKKDRKIKPFIKPVKEMNKSQKIPGVVDPIFK